MDKNISNIKERVLYISDYKGINKEEFFKGLGVSYANFKGVQKKSALSSNTLDIILSKYPDINAEWLVTGKGKMLKTEETTRVRRLDQNRKTTDAIIEDQVIPLYDFEATAGLQELFSDEKRTEVLNTIRIPNLPRCDGAITVVGDSMYPLLKSGDMVLYAETSPNNIFWGEMYLLGIKLDGNDEYITVKYVHKSELEGHIKLVSQNAHHDPKDIPLSAVRAIALVKASIRINTII